MKTKKRKYVASSYQTDLIPPLSSSPHNREDDSNGGEMRE